VSSLLPKELKGEGDTSRQWENENDVLVIPKFEQNPNKFVQLIPTFPTITPGIDGNPTGADPTFVIQASLYGGWWIRVRKKTTRSALQMHMKRIEAKKSGAVYVAIPQSLLQSDVMTLLGKEAGYKFYTHNEEREEMIWYTWTRENMESRVPSYATSIEGGGALVLSPDESEVLLVWEFGRWGRSGGAVDLGESCLEAAKREVAEETGLTLDDSFAPLLGLGYQMPCSRDGKINDHFLYFILKARRDSELKLDTTEIEKAKWFKIETLTSAWKSQKEKWEKNGSSATGGVKTYPSRIAIGNEQFGSAELMALEKFVHKQAQPVTLLKTRRPRPGIFF